MIAADIGLPDRFHSALKEITPFFGLGSKITKDATKRTNAFIEAAASVDLSNANEEDIPLIAMCVVADARNITVDDLIYAVFDYGSIEDEDIIKAFDKYGLKDAFWKLAETRFSYYEPQPSLLRFAMSLFATAIFRDMEDDMPSKWEQYKLAKVSNASVLLDNMKNSVIYQRSFDEVSEEIAAALNVKDELAGISIDKILNISDVEQVDKLIISWLIERELGEDTTAKLSGKSIPDVCNYRKRMHYGKKYANEYCALEAGYKLLFASHFVSQESLYDIAEKIKKGREKVHAQKATSEGEHSLFADYCSTLSIGMHMDVGIFFNYTPFQLYDAYRRFFSKEQSDFYMRVTSMPMMDTSKMEAPPEWQRNLY